MLFLHHPSPSVFFSLVGLRCATSNPENRRLPIPAICPFQISAGGPGRRGSDRFRARPRRSVAGGGERPGGRAGGDTEGREGRGVDAENGSLGGESAGLRGERLRSQDVQPMFFLLLCIMDLNGHFGPDLTIELLREARSARHNTELVSC